MKKLIFIFNDNEDKKYFIEHELPEKDFKLYINGNTYIIVFTKKDAEHCNRVFAQSVSCVFELASEGGAVDNDDLRSAGL